LRTRSLATMLVYCAAFALCIAGCGASGSIIHLSKPPVLPGTPGPPWFGFAGNAQHSALSQQASQPLARIHWRAAVDLAPQYQFGELLAHYGSVTVTHADNVIVPVKTGPTGGFRVDVRSPVNGAPIWSASSDYRLPAHGWVPSFNPSLTPENRLYFPGAGGKLFYRDDPDAASGSVKIAVFYGAAKYENAKAVYDDNVRIDTPITTDPQGDAFFGFTVVGSTPAGLHSGVARIGADGTGSWVSAATAAGDASITEVAMNCAPALSQDLHTLYVVVSNATPGAFAGNGYMLALDSTTLATVGKAFLRDPQSELPANIADDASASPTVGPDGDVYYGVLENPFPKHNGRGWLLHFDSTLAQTKIPGSFGWDDTASIVPASMVPSYAGTSSYLIMTKYNNYGGVNLGDGKNRLAILDPNATEPDLVYGNPVMQEVLTILGVTPDPNYPGGVKEWCINTAAVDPATDSVLADSEDGYLYRWDLPSNSFTQRIQLTSGVGEAYTPTVVGADGQVYAVNNAVVFALGQ